MVLEIIEKRPLGLLLVDGTKLKHSLIPNPLRCLDVRTFFYYPLLLVATLLTSHSRTAWLRSRFSSLLGRMRNPAHCLHSVLPNHGLYGSTSCCISQWPSQWGWANFDPPQLRNSLTDFVIITRHRASTNMYSLTFRVRVTAPPQYGRNATALLQITPHSQQARQFYRWQGESSPACVVRAVGLADYCRALPRISSVAIGTEPVHRLQIRPIVHN